MNLFEQIANQLADQRNQALNALAETQARLAVVQEELKQAQQKLHDFAADQRGPSGATTPPDQFAGS